MEFLKQVVNDCDYYLLIIGGRYGSLTSEGVSFTEKEYDYAVELGLKIVALLHGNPTRLDSDKVDADPTLLLKLDAFRNKVSTSQQIIN